MTPEVVFSIANMVAVLSWLVLVFIPRPRVVAAVSLAVPALLAGAYVLLIALHIKGSSGGFSSLADVGTLFGNPWLLLAGWVHYLAFDLFIGGWEIRDARRRSIPHVAVVPCLALTFLFGPAGWLLYLAVRQWWPTRLASVAIAVE